MKKIIVAVAYVIVFLIDAKAQSGIGTKNPTISSNLEVSTTNKGVLFPRMGILNINDKSPITSTPNDGLLIFNTNTNTKYTLFHWDGAANMGLGAWNAHLLFKETPKTAVIGIDGSNIAVLDNADPGNTSNVIGATNNLVIYNSGYLPNLVVSKTATELRTTIGSGTYTLEVSFLISAPAPEVGRGEPLQGSYYSMGYFIDFFLTTGGIDLPRVRTERSSLSFINEPHRVTFNLTFTAATNSSFPTSRFFVNIGRRSGSSHNDLVNIIPEGSYYKITKIK